MLVTTLTSTNYASDSLLWVAALLLSCLFLSLRSIRSWKARARGRPLPPGPRFLPIVGNLFNIPKSKAWLAFEDLSKQYGQLHTITISETIDCSRNPCYPPRRQAISFTFVCCDNPRWSWVVLRLSWSTLTSDLRIRLIVYEAH